MLQVLYLHSQQLVFLNQLNKTGEPKKLPFHKDNMGVTLYRPGTTHNINGILCELRVFNEYNFKVCLDKGWFFSPTECYPKEPVVEAKQDKKEKPVKKMQDTEIRKLAKDAGIKSWHVKKIDRLKKELEECQII